MGLLEAKDSNKLGDPEEEDLAVSESDEPIYQYVLGTTTTLRPESLFGFEAINQDAESPTKVRYVSHQSQYLSANPDQYQQSLQTILGSNPLLAALYLSSGLGLHAAPPIGFNHPQHLPINPYVALLLSHYGKYVPRASRGLYGYAAANNYHNNKPFGSYKIQQDP